MYLVVHLFNVMHCGSVFRIEFSHTDRVRHNSARIGSFPKSRYFVSSCSFSCPACPLSLSLSYFKCKSRKRLRSFSTEFDRFHPYLLRRGRMHRACFRKTQKHFKTQVNLEFFKLKLEMWWHVTTIGRRRIDSRRCRSGIVAVHSSPTSRRAGLHASLLLQLQRRWPANVQRCKAKRQTLAI